MILLVQDTQTTKDLLGQWLKWILEQPSNTNPVNDLTGEDAANGQQDHKDVWFLAGTTGWPHTIKRTCTIPSDRYLFIPVVSSDASYAEYPDLRTVEQLEERATEVALLHYDIELQVDGYKFVKERDLKWVVSEPQFIILPKNNIYRERYGVRGGPTLVVGAAYVAMLEPLPEGKHKLKFIGRHDPNEDIKVPEFILDIEYDIDVRNLS